MRWTKKVSETMKRTIRNWLDIQPSVMSSLRIQEVVDFELSAIRNRIWYRGDGNELEQLYQQSEEYADKYKFWGSKCSPGMEMRKIHTGLPGLIVRVLVSIVLPDMNDFVFDKEQHEKIWEKVAMRSKFKKKLQKALREVLYIGDGAWKIVIDTSKSEFPKLQWYPGDRIDLVYDGDDLEEIVFMTPFKEKGKQYVLAEHYGYGHVGFKLFQDGKEIDIRSTAKTVGLKEWTFDSKLMLGIPMSVYENTKWDGRGGSIFDGKLDNFDAYDEAWSQWMDALRAGRAKTYIPESYIPRDPSTGKLMKPNAFDNRFIAGNDNMVEGGKNEISTQQPIIPHDSYVATYITALDMCLQGIISPSTLGIDTKKLDNAEAQREKEKTTLYTRNAIVEALQEELPELISACVNAYNLLQKKGIEEVKVDIPFGEYANPSFESQIETVAKGKTGGIMSVEASVEELYGDTKDDEWKNKEIARLKAEQGIAEVEEPKVSTSARGFQVKVEGGSGNAG